MEDNILCTLKKLALIKKEKYEELFEYTFLKDFKVDIEEVEHIELYLRKRQFIFDDIENLNKEIDSITNSLPSNFNNSEIIKIQEQCKEIITKIIEIDKKNNIKFKQIKDLVEKNIKATKNSNKFVSTYSGVYGVNETASQFESFR